MQRGDHVRVAGWDGIAFWFCGHPERLVNDPQGWDPWDGEPEREPDHDTAIVRMVGDDQDREVPMSDLIPLDEDEFCGGCGQIGCGWGAA